MEIAERMRLENEEQFNTLVRMHLSFELDLNTDGNDILNEKAKLKKRFNFHKKPKSCTSAKSTSPACGSTQTLTKGGIAQLRQLIEFLIHEQSVIQEGIFRRTGSVARQNELKSKINEAATLNLGDGTYTVHDCASVLKGILADLPEPLLTDTYYSAHCQMAELCMSMNNSINEAKETHLLHSLQLLLLLLPQENKILLKEIIEMLNHTIKYEKSNKMSADSLATLFTPHLICPKKLAPEALHSTAQTMSGVVSFMITKGSAIFDIPPKLATDIRAYFVEQKRKKTLSPQHILDESVTSDSTANTVYTFIDREKTALAHVSNPTDTALAQLYAHIQSLPESSKKRKLIKQFNKENGQGTPLQLQLMQRLKNSSVPSNRNKSLGDSIKRHIFQKNLLSKTPKQPLTPSLPFGTPNRRYENLKTRLLFPSPMYTSSQTSISSASPDVSLEILKPTTSSNEICLSKSNEINLTPSPSRFADNLNKTNINLKINDKNGDTLLTGTTPRLSPFNIKKNIDNDPEHQCFYTPPKKEHNTLIISDLKSRYLSEPDLSRILLEANINASILTNRRYISNKLIKGVSMGNLGQKPSLPDISSPQCKENTMLDDSDFEATPNSQNSFAWSRELTTETPSSFIGRKSMSPITKSTQRMSKAMQESIMTPRSRKPVMLLGALIGSSDPATYENSFSSLREEDENFIESLEEVPLESNSPLQKSYSEGDITKLLDTNIVMHIVSKNCEEKTNNFSNTPESLTSPFKEYLFSRSVLTSSPVDSSFSSHPDDFGSTQDIQNMSESEINDSLLYCLDGNQPSDLSSSDVASNKSELNICLMKSGSQKREFEHEIHLSSAAKVHPKKIFKGQSLSEPGETSL